MPVERHQMPATGGFPEVEPAVGTDAAEPRPVGRERDLPDLSHRAVEHRQVSAGDGIPDPDGGVG